MKLSCALVLTLTNLVIATPFSFSLKGSGASAKAGVVTAPFGTFGVVQPVASNAGYTESLSKSSSLNSALGGTALRSGSFSHNIAQDNRAPWPGYDTSFTTQAQAVGQNVLTFPQTNKNSITSFSDTSVVATTGANGQTEITGSYPSENSNDIYVNNSGAAKFQYQNPPETQEKNPSSALGVSSLTSETYENSKPNALNFATILKVPEQSGNLKETSKVQNVSSQILTGGSAYLTFPNTADENTVPQTTVASSENYQIGEQKPNYNGGFGGPPGILKPFDKGFNVKSNDSANIFISYKPNVQLSASVTTKPQDFNYTSENTVKPSYVNTNKGSTDTTKPTVQSLSSGSSNFNADVSYKPERNPTNTFQIKPTFANNIGKPSSVLKPNDDQVHTLQQFDEITHTGDGTLTQSFEGSSKHQFSSQIPSKFNKPTIDAFSQSKPITEVQVSVQAYPTNVDNKSSEKLSSKPTKQSLYTGGFNASVGVLKPFDQLSPSSTFASVSVKPEVYNTSKPHLGFTVTSQKETKNKGGSSNILSAREQPSVVTTNYYTTPVPFISNTFSSYKPTNYKPFVIPSPLNTAKPNEDISITDQKDFSIVNDFETVSSLSQQTSDTASQKPSVVSSNYYTSPGPFISSKSPSSERNVEQHENGSGSTISSISKTDKKDNMTTTVQTETNQPSNEPSPTSSLNLTYKKNPSLFNVASSGLQSSTLNSNSYPVKPQPQFPEKQVFEFGQQKKPLFPNSFGTFVTPKPTSYPGSTAYTSFSSLGYGNSGVPGSLDKSKPTSQFISTNQYKPSFTNSFEGQSEVLKPSNQPTQSSSIFISSNKPTNYKPFVTPSPLNTAKPNEEISVTDQKDSSIVNDFETLSSLSQQTSDTASQKPSVVSSNYYTSPGPFISSKSPSSERNVEQHENGSGSTISSISKTDKKDNMTTTVQTETNQPSNEPSPTSSLNLTYKKNPSLFNVASSGLQSSTLNSNSYPVKPQPQFPEKQVFEFGQQKKPLFPNSFGTFVTPKPTSYPGSTAYTSFSSLGYGNSGVPGSLDKSKPTSQFISTNQYKPSFTNSFEGQSEVLKPSNQPTQSSSIFISSNKPTNYKPFVTPSPLNTAKPNEEISVTDQKDSSIVNDFETLSSLSQQTSDTASQKPSVVSTNYFTSPAPFISSKSPSSESNVEQHENASGSTISSTYKTDKKDNMTTTVQTKTNQPSNEPSQTSSLNLTNQKNPSFFNVASSGLQSSTLNSNSYPVKSQSQLPEKQVFEFGSQKKPLFSNYFGTFVTPKPTSYPGSTAYTSFSSLGYGNSGGSGLLDKSKPTSQFISTNQYKPSFTNSFEGQSGVLKPSNQPTQSSSTFISSNKPTNYKPFVTPSPLNTAKPNEEISITDQKDFSIVNDFGTVSSLSQQSSDIASQKPSVVSTNYYTSPAPFISTTVQTETNQPSNVLSQTSSFNLTYQKNPSLFNVASSGKQSSTLNSNSYPVKPQPQSPEKQVFEFGQQNKPLFPNSFGTFVTPKPTSYPGSTAHTSFSSLGYGNSGVPGSLDKSKPTNQFISTNKFKPSFTNSFQGQSEVLKPSNQPTQSSSTFISSNKPTNYKPFVTPSPLNTAKSNEEISVTDQKDSSIVNDFGTLSSLPQQTSVTASQKPSVVSTNYYTSPAPFISSKSPSSERNMEQHEDASGSTISSISKTDKKDNMTTTVQTETNQPSNEPSPTSSLNLTYKKNPSLFNVASSGQQSSTLNSNSYPVKPQPQFPEKQVFEFEQQKKPLFPNSFGTFVTPKPTSYPGSTAYTSFSSLGYGNSGVSGSLDKSKPTSQFTYTNQYKPSFTNSFEGQSEVLKPSNQPTQSSSTFISSNKPTNYKPFVTPSPLNTAKPNEDISVTDQKDSSIVNDFKTVSSLSQQASDTASQKPSVVSSNYYTSPAPFISSKSPSSESNVEQHENASGSTISSTYKTDKKDNMTTTVQTKTNQPSNEPSQTSSLNLTNQKNPSFFNVASSGLQSSTLNSNSYPVKSQSQLPEKQVFEFGSQKKPLFPISFGTFVTPKPTSYPGSTAYTSFSSLGYGNSGVPGSLDKSKPTSQFISTNQYKPSFTNSFQGQSEVLKPSNQPTQSSSTFISSNKPTNYKPFVTPLPLNTAKPNEEISVTDQKDSSIVNDFETLSSLSQQTSDTASQKPSVFSSNYYTSPGPFISSKSPSSERNVEQHENGSGSTISSISKTDKKDNMTTTVQTETNQPSNEPSPTSSLNLTYKKKPSLFNVASSGLQSSTLNSNSYPVKPQPQFPEKQVFEFGQQKKPLFPNSFGTFVTPKPTSYPGSTAYTSFSSLGYGNSGVPGSLDKSKPTSQFISTNQYKPSFTNSFEGQSEVLKPSNQPTQSSSIFISSNKPTNYKPFVTPSPLNTAKPNEEISVTDQKDSSIVNDFETLSSLSQQTSDTASQKPSVVSSNYYTSPAPFISSKSPSSESNVEQHEDASGSTISSTSKTDKKDNMTTTVQTETNQPSNEPSPTSSFNLTYKKNPSLFNVASSGQQSSTLNSNSYPVKPQSQLPEKQVFEFGSQKKPLFSNSFGTFVTPKPTSYPGSTAYTSFSSLGYGNSGVSGSLDKSKPTSQFTYTNQYKPSFTNSFEGQSGVLKPFNQPTQSSSTFISSNKPTNYKPFVTPSPLNTAKPNEEISVTDQKDSSIVNDFETVSSLSQQSSDTASQKPFFVSTNYYTSPAPFISSKSPSSEGNVEQLTVVPEFSDIQKVTPTIDSTTQTNHVYPDSTESAYVSSKSSGQQLSGNSALFNIQQGDFHLSKPNIQNSVIGQPSTTTVQLPYAGGFGGPAGILKPNEFSAPVNHINIPSQYNPSHYNQALTIPHRELSSASYSGGFGGLSGVLKPVKNENYTSAGNVVNHNRYFSIVHSSGLQGTLTENPAHSNYNLVPDKSFIKAQSNFGERNLGSKATEETQSGVVNQASVAATEGTGEFINHSHNLQNLENPFNNGASSGIELELPKNNKSLSGQISGLKIFRLTASNQGSTETGISSNDFGKSLAPGSAVAQGSSGFTTKSVFGRK